MTRQKKARYIFATIIILIVAFIGGIEFYHYQQTQIANNIQKSINKEINTDAKNRLSIVVPNPKHINITLHGGTATEIQGALATGKKLNKFDFWHPLVVNMHNTSKIVTQKYGHGITVSLMNPAAPTKALYSIKDGKVTFDVSNSNGNLE